MVLKRREVRALWPAAASRLKLLLIASLLALPALAAEPVLHSYFEPDPQDDLALRATTAEGDMPAALDTPSGPVSAPDIRRNPEQDEVAYGGTSTPNSVDASYRIDRNTTRPEVVSYDDPFIPAVTPFKRLYAYDASDDGLELVVQDKRLRRVTIGGAVESGDDQFYGDMVVDLAEDTPVRVPSVGPGARVLAAHTNPPTQFELLRDGADNWFIKAGERKRVRLVMQLAISRAVFGSEMADVSWGVLARHVPALPASARGATERVLARIGVSRANRPRDALAVLVRHFRSFSPSEARPTQTGASLYEELALTQKGVCRHRAYAFTITALALGLPTRMVRNEAHAWVEVFDGSIWHRIDLGGAAERMDTEQDLSRPQHRPPEDPYTWPAGSESGQEMAQRARDDAAASGSSGTGTNAAGTAGGTGSDGGGVTPVPSPSAAGPGALEADAGLAQEEESPRPPSRVSVSAPVGEVRRGEPLQVSGKIEAGGVVCRGVRVDFALRTSAGRVIPIQSLAAGQDGSYAGAIVIPPNVDVGDYELIVSTPGNLECGAGESE